MKKLMASLMALTMVFAVTGCSESEDSSSKSEAANSTTTTTTEAATTTAAEESEAPAETTADESEAPAVTDSSKATDDSEGGYIHSFGKLLVKTHHKAFRHFKSTVYHSFVLRRKIQKFFGVFRHRRIFNIKYTHYILSVDHKVVS